MVNSELYTDIGTAIGILLSGALGAILHRNKTTLLKWKLWGKKAVREMATTEEKLLDKVLSGSPCKEHTAMVKVMAETTTHLLYLREHAAKHDSVMERLISRLDAIEHKLDTGFKEATRSISKTDVDAVLSQFERENGSLA